MTERDSRSALRITLWFALFGGVMLLLLTLVVTPWLSARVAFAGVAIAIDVFLLFLTTLVFYYFLRRELDVRARAENALRTQEQRLAQLSAKMIEDMQELRDSREQFRIISNLTSDYTYCFRVLPDNRFEREWVTGAFTRITGYPVSESDTPSTWHGLMHSDDRLAGDVITQRMLAGQSDISEYRIIARDGQVRWVRDYVQPVWDDTQARVVRVFGATQDITDRKRVEFAEREQRQLAEALRDTAALLNSSPNPDQVITRILEYVGRVVPHDAANILLIEGAQARIVGSHGYRNREPFLPVTGMRLPLAENRTLQRILNTGTSLTIPETTNHPEWTPLPETVWVRSHLGAPIRSRQEIIGFLNLDSATPNFFDAAASGRLLAFADQAAVALDNARLLNETHRRVTQLQALNRAAIRIQQLQDPFEIYRVACDELRQIGTLSQVYERVPGGFQHVHTSMGDPLMLEYLKRFGETHHRPVVPDHMLGEPLKKLERGISVFEPTVAPVQFAHLSPELAEVAEWLTEHTQHTRVLMSPLTCGGKISGILTVLGRGVSAADMPTVALFARQVSTALDNARLFGDNAALVRNLEQKNAELEAAYDSTIEGWSRALDLRDHETKGHAQRVMQVTLCLARNLGVSDDELVHLRRGALLHDIGKMAIPDSILLKPGELNAGEWTVMREHPQLAYEMLAPIPYLNPALEIPYCHHERWDGSGYPRGLRGEEIPFVARIFAVVDVWDALLSDRPYRPGLAEPQVRAYLQAESGKLFDPRVIRAFLELKQKPPP